MAHSHRAGGMPGRPGSGHAPAMPLFTPRAFPPGLCLCCSLHLAHCSLCIRLACSFHALSLSREGVSEREREHRMERGRDGQRGTEVRARSEHAGVTLPGTHVQRVSRPATGVSATVCSTPCLSPSHHLSALPVLDHAIRPPCWSLHPSASLQLRECF